MRPASASVVLAEPARREPGPLAAFTPVQKNRKKPRIAVWLALLMVAGIALAAGAGLFSGGQPARLSLYERTLQIAGQYRCPVCEGETAAASQSSEAVEIRAYIGQALSEGHSPAQIRSYLMSRYGESILEKPPASGVGVVLWALPVLVVLLAGGGLGFAFVRWRRASAAGRAPGGGAPGGGAPGGGAPGGGASGGGAPGGGASGGGLFIPGTTAATGPVGTALYRGPGVGPAEAAAEAAVAPSAAPAAEAEAAARPLTPGRRWYRRLTLGGGAALMVLAAALFVVDRASSPRLPGDTVSGGQGSITARLAQAEALASSDPAASLSLFGSVLAQEPRQPVALTYAGWMYAQAGYASKGLKMLATAEAVTPAYEPAHFYRGLVLLDYAGDPAAAAAELRSFLASHPATEAAHEAEQALAFAEAELRVAKSKSLPQARPGAPVTT